MGLFGSLANDPTVTVDVFHFSGQLDKGYLQWAIAPFEVEYTLANKTKVKGMEMVFFEGWSDTVSKDAEKPLTNETWSELFAQGDYKKFKSLLKAP
jgi:hypothetical protein